MRAPSDTADTKARMRSELERTLSDIDGLMAKGRTQVTAAERTRVPQGVIRQLSAALAEARGPVQEAREAVAAGDYLHAREALGGVKGRVEKAMAATRAEIGRASCRERVYVLV